MWFPDLICDAAVEGAAVCDSDVHHDAIVFKVHDAPDCEGRQVFKMVLRTRSVLDFQGRILVKRGAQMQDAARPASRQP